MGEGEGDEGNSLTLTFGRIPTILNIREKYIILIKREYIMIIGKVLKEKYGFNNPEKVNEFTDKYFYSKRIVEGILSDKYPVLLTCHLNDISEFTGIPFEMLNKMQDDISDYCLLEYLEKIPPMGKPYIGVPPVMVKLDIKEIN